MRYAEAFDGMYCGRAKTLAVGRIGGRQSAKTNYCAWQMGSMYYGVKEWTDGNFGELLECG